MELALERIGRSRAEARKVTFFAPGVGGVFARTYIMMGCHFDTLHPNARTNA